ncbi:3-oxoacyl-[acyl-carrier-protein] synthase III C-terminal domain-containing protein [Streptomyces sp. UG1]|uniref:3-oxoacyl-[acyl-carrier-protein] synthase III C-terminal domain-containing protein n=1 Tax=Streptomyces sp. UG1 TaxID=3417652 RepID=UPI003CEED027
MRTPTADAGLSGAQSARTAGDPIQERFYGPTERGVPMAQVALAWLLRRPAITARRRRDEAASPQGCGGRPGTGARRDRNGPAAGALCAADRLSELVEYGTGYIELFNFADGAAAVLLTADPSATRYEVLGGAHHTDPQWVDSYYGEFKNGEIKVERGEKLDGLGDAFLDNFTTLTHQVLAGIGADVPDVAYFLVTHGNQDTHRKYLAALGVDASRSVFQYERDGHLGGADPFSALEELEQEERVGSGGLVIVATAGSGFTWGVTALRRT